MNCTQTLLGRGFRYDCEIIQPDGQVIRFTDHNLLPQVSIDHAAGLLLGTAAPISSWYVFLFEGNYVPDATAKAADLPSLIVECTAYAEASRPLWAGVYDGVSVIDNLDSKAVFTLTADKLIYGAGLISASTKGGSSGVMLSIARYATPQDVKAGAQFSVGIGSVLAAGA